MLIWVVFGAILLIISINDFLFFRIENEYILSLIILYTISCTCRISGNNFLEGMIVAIITFIITITLNKIDMIGGGDVKLLFPAILLSENNLSAFWLGTSIGGAFLAIAYILCSNQISLSRRNLINSLLCKKRNKSYLLSIALLSLSRIDKRVIALEKCTVDIMKQEIPYGVAISCGGFYVIIENLVAK